MLSFVSLLLAIAPPQQGCTPPPQDRVLDQFQTGFPYSIPNAMGVSADGRYIYCGEGGAIAIVDTLTWDATPPGTGANSERIPISKYGPRPAKILVDPGTDPGNEDDLLLLPTRTTLGGRRIRLSVT